MNNSMNNSTWYQSELPELMSMCRNLLVKHQSIDYYSTTIGIGLVIILGVLGNAGTLLTLSGRRLTTATFVYYRAIAMTDLIRCIFVLSYVLRVMVPFKTYYGATWYEAHVMYFIIAVLSFVSISLAVTLCVRLCIGILQSRRLKKTKTNPKTTKVLIYFIIWAGILVNGCLCYEYEVTNRHDFCARRRLKNEFQISATNFHINNSEILMAIHLLPVIILLILICGAGSILACCLLAVPRTGCPEKVPSPKTSTNALLVHHCPSVRHSRPWRTQRQLCKLFLLLSVCYAIGVLPEFLYLVIFPKGDTCGHNCSGSTQENYPRLIRRHFDEQNFISISNVFQNIGFALPFYVYVMCSDAFRGEFLVKLRRLKSRFFSNIWPYSRALGCTSIGALLSEKISQSSDTKHPLRSVTLLAELDSEEGFATTFAPEQIMANDQAALEMMHMETTLAIAASSYANPPIFTVADSARRMSTRLHSNEDEINPIQENCMSDHIDPKSDPEIHESIPMSDIINTQPIMEICDKSLSATSDQALKSDIISPVQLQPHRYQRFYSSEGKKRDSMNSD